MWQYLNIDSNIFDNLSVFSNTEINKRVLSYLNFEYMFRISNTVESKYKNDVYYYLNVFIYRGPLNETILTAYSEIDGCLLTQNVSEVSVNHSYMRCYCRNQLSWHGSYYSSRCSTYTA